MSYIWCLKNSALREQQFFRNGKSDSLKLIVHKMHHILSNYLTEFSLECVSFSDEEIEKLLMQLEAICASHLNGEIFFILSKIYENTKRSYCLGTQRLRMCSFRGQK